MEDTEVFLVKKETQTKQNHSFTQINMKMKTDVFKRQRQGTH